MAEAQTDAVQKLTVSLKAIGNTPQLAKKKFLVEKNRTVGWIHSWLKHNLKIEADESLFVFVAQVFAPALDVTLDSLYQCYGVGDKLILQYCKAQAWG